MGTPSTECGPWLGRHKVRGFGQRFGRRCFAFSGGTSPFPLTHQPGSGVQLTRSLPTHARVPTGASTHATGVQDGQGQQQQWHTDDQQQVPGPEQALQPAHGGLAPRLLPSDPLSWRDSLTLGSARLRVQKDVLHLSSWLPGVLLWSRGGKAGGQFTPPVSTKAWAPCLWL